MKNVTYHKLKLDVEGGGDDQGKQLGQSQLWVEEGDLGLRENNVEKDNITKK